MHNPLRLAYWTEVIMSTMNRRQFLGVTAAAAASSLVPMRSLTQAPMLPELETIIDTHVHFYDPSRPGGVPWPPASDTLLYRTVLPETFKRATAALGIKSVIEVEASPLLEDNQWVLSLATHDPIVLGTCGDIEIGKPGFGNALERFLKSGRFYGIRIGNLWNRNLSEDIKEPETIANLKLLAQAGLEVDIIGGFSVLPDVIDISDQVPELRIVVEHMPFDSPDDEAELPAAENALREIGQRRQIFSKVSNVLRKKNGQPVEDLAFYRPSLDQLSDIFGIDRLIYGSNWPVSEKTGPYELVFRVVREYFAAKGRDASRKFFAANSETAYHWKARNA
jgi:L-fuconolactonase